MTKQKDNYKVIYWLLTGCALLFIMVVIGGITRLTNSGLSMSDYKLITGTIPPLNEAEWQEAFALYQQYPEFQKLHSHFTLSDFKGIYFWEWLHRVIGRLIGLVFLLPFLYFLATKQLSAKTIKKSLFLLFLGAFQGALGWYMVKSGLVDMPHVSHYRLSAHLTTAFFTFAATLWVALDLMYPIKKPVDKKFRNLIIVGFIVLAIQIIYGGFVAGLKAGLLHNHWPFMNEGKILHHSAYVLDPWYVNLIENPSGIQFIHRTLAYFVVIIIGIIWYRAQQLTLTKLQTRGVHSLLLLVCLQFFIGVITIIYGVPIWLGVAHQIGAFFLVSAMTFTLHRFSK